MYNIFEDEDDIFMGSPKSKFLDVVFNANRGVAEFELERIMERMAILEMMLNIEDVEAFEKHRFPCWARGVNMRGPYKDGPGSINVQVSIGGMVVNPGDVILGDCDGIIALSPNIALEGARLGKEKEAVERKTIQSILDGQYDDAWIDVTLKQKGVL